LRHERQRTNLTAMLRDAKKAWHGVKLDQPDWGDGSLSVALGGELSEEGLRFHFILNAFWEPLTFELPKLPSDHPWRRWIDTSLDSPKDITPWEESAFVTSSEYLVGDRSVVMLFSNASS
jgi:glycogen operon protein